MKLALNFKNCRASGFGILEFSILFVITSVLIFGVWGLASMMQAQRALEYRADKIFYEQTLPIWKMSVDLKLTLNTSELENYLALEADELFSTVAELNDLTPGKSVFVELAIARLEIDEKTGAPIGKPAIFKLEQRGSDSFISNSLASVADFGELFAKFEAKDSRGASLWAVPLTSALSLLSYRDTAFFVAARVFVEAEGFAAWFKSIIGYEPVFFISRAYALRGDVDL